MNRRTVLAGVVVVPLLAAGCGGQSREGDPLSEETATMPMVSRGLTATVIPTWVKPGVAMRAAEFVAVAATPDVRVDEAPINAWRRATSIMTPALVTELDKGSALGDVSGWRRLQRLDGWVSIEFSNVLGDEPQAVPGPEGFSSPTGEGVEMEVVFTRIIHAQGQRDVRESEPLVWQVKVTGDQVSGVGTVTTTG